MENVRDYQSKELEYFVLSNVIMILLFCKVISIKELISGNNMIGGVLGMLLSSAVYGSVLYMAICVIDTIIPISWKEKLVFWNEALPGEIVFSEIDADRCKDRRFLRNEAVKAYADIYSDFPEGEEEKKHYENAKWYALFKLHEDRRSIKSANRDYLMCRDMSCASVVLFGLYLLAVLMIAEIVFDIRAVLVIIGEYILLNIACRNKATRLVNSVIANDLAVKEKEAKGERK